MQFKMIYVKLNMNIKDLLKDSCFEVLYIIFVLEIPIYVVMTKMDECDLAEEAIRDLKRKICSSLVINMDRILECVNYKRSDTQSGWWDNDAVEKVLNFLTSVSNFIMKIVFQICHTKGLALKNSTRKLFEQCVI